MVVGNRVTEVGDVLYIKTDVPAIGLLALTGFSDVTENETEQSYFNKLFRYSIDGITWTTWIVLNTTNIQAVPPFPANAVLFLEYRYEKVGGGEAAFDQNTVTATYQATTCGYYFVQSFFSEFFSCDSIEVLGWYLNVTEKLYKKGALAAFIGRTNDSGVPDDFIQFWKSVSKFFAYYVIYARKWQTFYQNADLAKEFLSQRGMFTSTYTTLPDAVTLMNKYNQQMSLRGTETPFLSVRDNDAAIDGEILRAIDFNIADEFMFNLYRPELFGWNVGNCSPLYSGLQLNDSLNKFYEITPSDISKYPITGTGASITTDGPDHVIELVNSAIGDSASNKFIYMNPSTDYELSFLIKKISGTPLDLSVGLFAFDANGNAVNSRSFKDGSITNFFVQHLDIPQSGYYYLIRCIFYNSSRTTFYTQDSLNVHAGNNLVIDASTVKLIPNIVVGSTGLLKNIVIRPLFTEYSRGFVQVNNFISCWLDNRNQKFDTEELEGWIKRYQIPYNAHIKLTQLGTNTYNVPPVPPIDHPSSFSWIGGSPVCNYVEAPIGTFIATKTIALLLQVNDANGLLTGVSKANVDTDPDYIPPSTDNLVCPVYYTQWVPVEETAYCEPIT